MTDALKARAHELKRLGLAIEVRRNVLRFEPGWRDALTAMELHLDIRKGLMRSRTQLLTKGPQTKAARISTLLRGPER